MKKFFMTLLILILIVVAGVCFLLFTSTGNNILKPQLQAQINKYSPIPATIEVFELRFSKFHFVLSNNNINADMSGTFSLFTQSVDSVLNVNIVNPHKTSNNASDFSVESYIRGKITNLSIDSVNRVADGRIRANSIIKNFKPAQITANIENLDIAFVLESIGYKPYVNGKLKLDADIVGDENLQFGGNITASISNGGVSQQLVKQDFDIVIPNTTFVLDLTSNFNGSNLSHKLALASNVGNVNITGSTRIPDIKTNSTYDIKISDLSPFTPLVGHAMRGALSAEGTIVGNGTYMNIEGKSNFASGNTTYSISTRKYTQLKDASISIKNMRLENLLYSFALPIYANGPLNAEIDLKGIDENMSGNATLDARGSISKKTIYQEFNKLMSNDIAFTNKTSVVFNNNSGVLNATLNTEVARFDIKNALVLMLMDSLILEAPYALNINDLRKLAFITTKELKGAMNANGNIKLSPELRNITFNTSLFGGNIEATLNNNLANIIINNANLKGVLDMLQYPQFFSTNLNGNIKYDTKTDVGTLELIATNGSFTQNALTDTLRKTTGFDATKEIYNNISITGRLNKEVITADLQATSGNTKISTKDARIDFGKDVLDVYLSLTIKDKTMGASITGNAKNPRVQLDIKKVMQDLLNPDLLKEFTNRMRMQQ